MATKKPTKNVKTTFQLHSKAKVEFYTTYLKRYLRIINRVLGIKQINIFDVFCGMGIYEDGGKGSPVAAFDVIGQLVSEETTLPDKLTLHVNDIELDKVSNFKSYIDSKNVNNKICNVNYYNFDVSDMFDLVIDKIQKSGNDTANLVFIDPYGYKTIKKDIISKIMQKKGTEIILFLPISQMYRFTNKAIADENNTKAYLPLKTFIESFFSETHPIRNKGYNNVLQYIDYIKEGLKLENEYLTTSYHIERSTSHYFALFFITKSVYGLEKILEVKWELNEENGEGFDMPEPPSLFADTFALEQKEENFRKLKSIILSWLNKQPLNNRQIYRGTLHYEFLPKHTNEVLRQLYADKLIYVADIKTNKPARKNAFYINWDNYKSGTPRVEISIRK